MLVYLFILLNYLVDTKDLLFTIPPTPAVYIDVGTTLLSNEFNLSDPGHCRGGAALLKV